MSLDNQEFYNSYNNHSNLRIYDKALFAKAVDELYAKYYGKFELPSFLKEDSGNQIFSDLDPYGEEKWEA